MEKKQPFITIGIASYNYARYLRQGFEAIRQQHFRDFEVLYADDGSTDDSVGMIESFIRDNPDMAIRIVKGHNIGVMGNKQRLIDNARGTYLMLCDADDWMDIDCLEILASAAMETGADRVVSQIRNINGISGKIMYVQSFPKHPSKWCETLHHGALYKLKVIQDNRLSMPDRLPDDFLFITHFNIYAKNTYFVHDSVYNWRLHPESAWQKNRHDNSWRGYKLTLNEIDFFLFLQKEYYDYVSERDIEDLKLYFVKNYCYYLINDISSIQPWKKARKEYNKLKGLMLNSIPHYQWLVFKRWVGNSPFRPSLHMELCVLCFLETLRCLFPSLMAFGCVTKMMGGRDHAKHTEC